VRQSKWNRWLHAVLSSAESTLIGVRQMEQSSAVLLLLLDACMVTLQRKSEYGSLIRHREMEKSRDGRDLLLHHDRNRW
jgi:hypothetical protein